MRYTKAITFFCMLVGCFAVQAKPSPSLEDIFGLWEIDGEVDLAIEGIERTYSEEVEAAKGISIEFRRDYLIVNGVQYNHPAYLWTLYPTLRDAPRKAPCKAYICYDLKMQGPVLFVDFEEYNTYEVLRTNKNQGTRFEESNSLRIANITLDEDRLIMNFGGNIVSLKRCPDPPWYKRAWAQLKCWFSIDTYNPRKVVPKEMFGAWEVYKAQAYIHSDGSVKAGAAAYIGKQIEIQPKYLVLDGVRYNKPHYWRGSPDDKVIYLDRHNNYHLLGKPCHSIWSTVTFCFCMVSEELEMEVADYYLTLRRSR